MDNWTDCCLDSAERSTINITVYHVFPRRGAHMAFLQSPTPSCTSRCPGRQGMDSFFKQSLCFNIVPCRHMPLLVHCRTMFKVTRGKRLHTRTHKSEIPLEHLTNSVKSHWNIPVFSDAGVITEIDPHYEIYIKNMSKTRET